MKKLVTAFLALLAFPLTQTPALASGRATVIVRLAPGGSVRELHERAGAFPVRALARRRRVGRFPDPRATRAPGA